MAVRQTRTALTLWTSRLTKANTYILDKRKCFGLITDVQQQAICTSHGRLQASVIQPEPMLSVTPTETDTDSHIAERPPLPMITSRKVDFPNLYCKPKQAWLENLDTMESLKLGIIDLHPDIFATYPRLDILHRNTKWQQTYKRISYASTKTRAEVSGTGKKPFPQKKTGRHRSASLRGPQYRSGGICGGPRGPKSFFYMLPQSDRALGLRVALSVKFAQNDLHIVDNLEIPTDDPSYIDDLIDTRFWGFSALFVDVPDIMPRNISLALQERDHFNLMPVYGLNVHSMLKHETLVLTLRAVEKLEEKLLYQMHKPDNDVKFRTPPMPRPNKEDKVPYFQS